MSFSESGTINDKLKTKQSDKQTIETDKEQLSALTFTKMNSYWQAANYLSVIASLSQLKEGWGE